MSSSSEQISTLFAQQSGISKRIAAYAADTFPDLTLSPEMLKQLYWLQVNPVVTSQAHVLVKPDEIHMEVTRSLTRLYCARLLRKTQGEGDFWERFTATQNPEGRLQRAQFDALSALICALSPEEYASLEASCFIAKTPWAGQSVPEPLQKDLPTDSEQFISYIVDKCPDILPVCEKMSTESRDSLRFAFYFGAHARHMLDLEGGNVTLVALRAGVMQKIMTPERLNLWFSRWIINMAGLNGHQKPLGSHYLTETVADCTFVLKHELDQLLTNPQHPVLENYMAFRLKSLGVSNVYLAYLGSLMRKNTPDIGAVIQKWFDALAPEVQQARLDAFQCRFNKMQLSPTYMPTLLQNLVDAKNPLEQALEIFATIEGPAVRAWEEAVRTQRLPASTPLSFMETAYRENLPTLVAMCTAGAIECAVNEKGGLIVQALAPQEVLDSSTPGP